MLRPALCVALALWLAGCERAAPARLVVAVPVGLHSRDIHDPAVEEFGASILSNVYETLVDIEPDLGARPGLAEAWRSPDDRTWIFTLRKGLHFSDGRPPYEQVGVQLVEDVEPYELMKLRLLNASHQAMSYLGLLAGETYVHDVCRDELFSRFLLGYMHEEARPTLAPVPGIDIDAYCAELMRRFGSEAIKDTLARQIVDGSEHIPKFLLPVVREQLRTGGGIARSALVLAAWSRLIEGVGDDGRELAPVDRRLAELQAAVAQEAERPGAFLDLEVVFGDLGSDARLRKAFIAARARLANVGARAAVEEVVAAG